jgi:hypothetical protein
VAVAAVGHGAADGSEEEHGNLAGEAGDAEQGGRAGQTVDQPGLGLLHPVPTSETSCPLKKSR